MILRLWVLLCVLLGTCSSGLAREGCREVEVQETQVCKEQEVEECGPCSTVHMRECTIQMVDSWVPVRVKRCTESQSSGCERGSREVCRVQYRTSCSSRLQYQQVEEDFPKCRKEKVTSCPGDDPLSPGCREVEAVRCRIERRTVRKARPVTACRRLPINLCGRRKCKQVTGRGLE